MKILYRSVLLIAPALSMAIAAPVVARAADNGQSTVVEKVEQVVVTARRTSERLQDVPMSISVLNQHQLSNFNVSTAGDLATYVPALTVNNEFGNDATSFVIRGFSQDIGTSPTVGVYFADVIAPRGGFGGATIHAGEGAGPGALFDLQNVQVLKGPQGTLFGRNTTGGAILLVPKRPDSEFGGYLEASGGNYNMERVQGVINIPVSDKLRIRAGFDQQRRDGYLENISGIGPSDFNDINYIAARLSVDADITPNLENYTIFSLTNSDNNGFYPQLVACDPTQGLGFLACLQIANNAAKRGPYTVNNPVANAKSRIDKWQVINTTTWHISDDLTFKNIASYSQLNVVNNTGLFGNNFSLAGYPISFSGENSPPGTPLSNQGAFTEEPRLQGTAFDGRMQWQAGLYWEMSYPLGFSGWSGPSFISCTDFRHLQCFDFPALLEGLPQGTVGTVGRRYGRITYRDYAVYAQDTFSITDKWKLTTGIRYTEDITSSTTARYAYRFPAANTPVGYCEDPLPGSFYNPAPGANCIVSDHQKSSAPTGLVNLTYQPNDDLLFYAQYARAYRQGGILATGPIGYTTFKPENLNAYEAGVKSTLTGSIPGVVNLAVFYNDFSDQQVLGTFISTIAGAPPNAGILNVGSSRIWGIDLDSTLALTDNLSIDLGYTYLNSELVSLATQHLTGYSNYGPNELPGSSLALTPDHKLTLTATYQVPMDADLGQLSIAATYVYTSSQLVYGEGPYSHLPATNLLNFNINWESFLSKPVDIELFMTNATDLHYPTYIDNFSNPTTDFAQYGLVSELYGPPRMFGARVRYHF